MKNKLGELVGYQVSMISHFSKDTQIFVKTTGVLLEELLYNKIDYSYILLDEVHERDLYVDLVLALLKHYFIIFPESDAKVILMSATIAENEFANYLKEINYQNEDVPIIRVKEKWHEVCEFQLEDIVKKMEYIQQLSMNSTHLPLGLSDFAFLVFLNFSLMFSFVDS